MSESQLWADFSSELGRNIRAARKKRGWTLEQLSLRSGLSLGYIANLERGVGSGQGPSNISVRNLVTLAMALDVNLDALLPAGDVPDLRDITDLKHR